MRTALTNASSRRFRPAVLAAAIVAVVFPALLASGQTTPVDRLDTAALSTETPSKGVILDIVAVEPQSTEAQRNVRLVAVGDRGRILISDDQAASWRQAASPIAVELTAVAFSAEGVGVAVGHDGAILRSEDAGESWSAVIDGRTLFPSVVEAAQTRVTAAEAAVEAADEDGREDAEFALEDEVFRLETAETSIAFGPSWPFLDVYWSDDETVWAIGAYGLAFVSKTAGATWELASAGFDNFEDFHFYSMLGTRAGTLLVVGEGGVIFASQDGGETWERFDTDDGASLFGVAEIGDAASPSIIAYGFGDAYQVSQDGGVSWDRRDLGVTAILVGHVKQAAQARAATRLRALGASGQMIELGADGVGQRSQPTGDRSFLSVGFPLDAAEDGALLIGSEAGLHVTGAKAE